MTIKELFILVESTLSNCHEVVSDEYLADILEHSIMHRKDFSNRPDIKADSWTHFEYGKADSFDIKQLDEELPSGYSIYYYVIDLDDIIIEHFKDKFEAFNQFRSLSEDTLVIDKILIDNSKGILAGGKQGEEAKGNQYKLYLAWIKTKYPLGTTIQYIQEYKKGQMIFHDRSELIGKIGTVVEHDDFSNLIKVDFGEYGTTHLEVSKDQFRIIN